MFTQRAGGEIPRWQKVGNRDFRFLARRDREWPLNDGQIPNPNVVRGALGSRYHRVDGNLGGRHERPSERSPTRNLYGKRFAVLFCIAVREGGERGGGAHCGRERRPGLSSVVSSDVASEKLDEESVAAASCHGALTRAQHQSRLPRKRQLHSRMRGRGTQGEGRSAAGGGLTTSQRARRRLPPPPVSPQPAVVIGLQSLRAGRGVI